MTPRVAFITGVNGITGSAICTYLVNNSTPLEWSKIYVTSRSPLTLPTTDKRVEFIALDFLKSPTELAKEMKAICSTVTHAFFSSYIHKDKLADLQAANKGMFENFLTALIQTAPTLQKILPQTGAKYYNGVFEVVPLPSRESDPRRVSAADNFYYPQEDCLAQKQKDCGGSWTWNVVRPVGIVGYAPKANGMNMAMTMAVYFLLCKELGEEAKMGTNVHMWHTLDDISSAPIIANMSVYVVTHDNCANEAFNITNGDAISWRTIWPQLAGYFGAHASSNQEFTTPVPKVGEFGQEFSFEEWFKGKEEIWNRICERKGGKEGERLKEAWGYVGGDLMDWAYARTWSCFTSMSKARKFGWTGYADSFDSFVEAFEEYKKAGLLPN